MPQFDVHRLPEGTLVVDLQTDLIGLDATRIVAPLREESGHTVFPGLTPRVTLDGADWIVWVQQLAAVPAGVLGPRVATLRESRDALLRAVDILTHGF